MKRNKRYTIWSNDSYQLTYEEALEQYKEHQEANDLTDEVVPEKVWEYVYESLFNYGFEDELENLKSLNENTYGFLCIGDLGLWDGVKSAYKETFKIEDAISDCIPNMGTAEIYAFGQDLKITAYHHDGTNYFRIREWKADVSQAEMQKVRNAIFEDSENKEELIRKHTKGLSPRIALVYGW